MDAFNLDELSLIKRWRSCYLKHPLRFSQPQLIQLKALFLRRLIEAQLFFQFHFYLKLQEHLNKSHLSHIHLEAKHWVVLFVGHVVCIPKSSLG